MVSGNSSAKNSSFGELGDQSLKVSVILHDRVPNSQHRFFFCDPFFLLRCPFFLHFCSFYFSVLFPFLQPRRQCSIFLPCVWRSHLLFFFLLSLSVSFSSCCKSSNVLLLLFYHLCSFNFSVVVQLFPPRFFFRFGCCVCAFLPTHTRQPVVRHQSRSSGVGCGRRTPRRPLLRLPHRERSVCVFVCRRCGSKTLRLGMAHTGRRGRRFFFVSPLRGGVHICARW